MSDNQPPLIGITTYAKNERNEVALPAEYADSVRRAGGIPMLIPPGERRVAQLLSRVEGLLLTGGGDIDPGCYAGQDHSTIDMVDTERDDTEIALAKHAIKTCLPTLAICRGLQIVNVALGGTLHGHLPDTFGEEVLHSLPPQGPVAHQVCVESESRVARIMQATSVSTMSWHHQGLCDVAAELKIVAKAPDGVIEAVELDDHPWLIAIQWHPELTAATDVSQQRLFDELVRQARSGQS